MSDEIKQELDQEETNAAEAEETVQQDQESEAEQAEETAQPQESEETEQQQEQEPTEEEKLRKELEESKDKYLRLMAEYDNFRKRSAKERLELSATVKGNTISEILPVFDNFERALAAETEDTNYKAGVEMIFKQFGDMLTKLGVEMIDPLGQTFDPNIANAVNQIEDEKYGENEVAQVFQKGYKIGDKVIRYAMVVVANP
ncbi:nucleotide exchange factor GrpE [Ruminococcus sp. FC2018]|uniref:nucleotide exchange factor GrpE n=1 Tax=Ruminococcus sp. FC2018 TaxID=1410617 RepID=UPI000AB57797|nr:nucleotide exchange factor GrpE [Ruminococcus sp. FC2018]